MIASQSLSLGRGQGEGRSYGIGMIFRQNKLLTIIVALGVLGATFGLGKRYSVEMKNRAVEITVDYAEVAQLAGASGLAVPQALDRLKQSGVTSVAVPEKIVGDLVASGAVLMADRQGVTWLRGLTPKQAARLRESSAAVTLIEPGAQRGFLVAVKAKPEYVFTLPVGLPSDAVDEVRQARMPVVARLVNHPGVRKADVEKIAAELQQTGVKTVIFSADQVLGFRGSVNDSADAFKDHGLTFGSIEFSKQKGDDKFALRMLPDVVRVHSVSVAEMGTLDRASAVERFVRAAKERNIRIAYVRMFDLGAADPLRENQEYISDIVRGLRADGFEIRPAHPFQAPAPPLAARALIGFGVAAGVMLLMLSLVKLPARTVWPAFVLIAIILAGMAAPGVDIGLKLVALLAAIVFPTVAVLYAASGSPDAPLSRPLKSFLPASIVRFVGALAISFAGGLMVAALLSKPAFMLHVDQFAGVKLAHIAPILLIAVAFSAGIAWRPDIWAEQKSRAEQGLRKLGSQPILMWQTIVALVLLVMIALLLARSGNDSGVGVSQTELRFRAILDTLLFVRPRTKEFLLGHPAMLIGIAMALGGRRNWAPLFLLVGLFGEISLVNTFCHIHTQISVSILRSAIGAALGLIIGIVLLLIFSRGNIKKDMPTD